MDGSIKVNDAQPEHGQVHRKECKSKEHGREVIPHRGYSLYASHKFLAHAPFLSNLDGVGDSLNNACLFLLRLGRAQSSSGFSVAFGSSN